MLSYLLLILLLLSSAAYYLGRNRAFRVAGDHIRNLHSLPSFYGSYTALWCGLPALIVVTVWAVLQPGIILELVVAGLPPELRELPPDRLGLVLNDIKNLVSGNIVSGTPDPTILAAAEHYRNLQLTGHVCLWIAALLLATAGLVHSWRAISPKLRARNRVERVVTLLLIVSSTVAIFTTIGIVLSVLFESIRFFHKVPLTDFLLGLQWSPQTAIRADQIGSSGAFGMVPLFAGTLLIFNKAP